MDDALWIGVSSMDEGGTLPSLNVFRKNGDNFELVKILEGDEAEFIYDALTRTGEDQYVTEVNVQGL